MKRKLLITLLAAVATVFGALTFTACNVTGGTTDGDTDKTEPTTQYSQILQNVLTDSYYAEILDSPEKNSNRITPVYGPTPFKFLQQRGHDVAAYKSGALKAESIAYVKNDDTSTLYLSTRVKNVGNTNYYTNYILKYNLTKQEYSDLYMLHSEKYMQAGLFIQELDKQKTAVVESETNYTTTTYRNFENLFTYNTDFKNFVDYNQFDIIDFAKTGDWTHNITFALQPPPKTQIMLIKTTRKYLKLETEIFSGTTITNNI
ncbi:MAG: hypothetical protein K2I30_04125 [Clostridia bacterium]|nr:hypothetical protein [Clostridia bacterium]